MYTWPSASPSSFVYENWYTVRPTVYFVSVNVIFVPFRLSRHPAQAIVIIAHAFHPLATASPLLSWPVALILLKRFNAVTCPQNTLYITNRTRKKRSLARLSIYRAGGSFFSAPCSQDLPEVFENDMAQWMEGFHNYLEVYANPLLDQPEGSEAPGPIERVQVSFLSVCVVVRCCGVCLCERSEPRVHTRRRSHFAACTHTIPILIF